VLRYVARPPTPRLAKFVEYLWASQGAPAHAKERVVPTGTLELFVSLVEGKARIYDSVGNEQSFCSSAGVSGAYRRPFTFDTRENASVVGVHFRPGYAGVILGVPPGELTDRHLDLGAIWGRRAGELRERLCAARTTEQRFAILEAQLMLRLDERHAHPVVAYALEVLAGPGVQVGDIAKQIRLSPRRLIQMFTADVGLTPKRFGRIRRFQRAAALARGAAIDWTRVAHESGYYDQAHLIRDFRELADVTPTGLLRASAHPNEPHQFAVAER
jgi:AraC-like DNA-binding protein